MAERPLPCKGCDAAQTVEAWAGLPQERAIKDLADSGTQRHPAAFQEFPRLGVPLSRRATGDPPKKTAAPMGVGSGGKGSGKPGGNSKVDIYYTDLCTATAPRIIALHWGDA